MMFRKAVFSLLLTVVVVSPAASLPNQRSDSRENGSLASSAAREEREIFSLINSVRAKRRLPALEWDSRLAGVARAYSEKMAREHFFNHWDRNGETVSERAEQARISDWKTIGENLFFCDGGDEISGFAVNGWMGSATHRSNILDRRWTATGIGLARTRNGGVYITQVFVEN